MRTYAQVDYLYEIEIKNTRCFGQKQIIKFHKNGKICKWNLIIGDNGLGKTTILKTIGLLSTVSELGYSRWNREIDPEFFIRSKNSPPEIKMKLNQGLQVTNSHDILPFTIKDNDIICNAVGGVSININAYGATRTIGETAITIKEDFPLITLYDENSKLINAEEWIVQRDYYDKKWNKKTLKNIIPILTKIFKTQIHDIVIKERKPSGIPKVIFITNFGEVNIHELSLGTKTIIGWIVDLTKRLFDFQFEFNINSDPLKLKGIVLVDEIDLHIHPKLQKELTYFLTDTFPNIQFIVTSHSPLTVQASSYSNIIFRAPDPISGDQLVTSCVSQTQNVVN